MKKYAALFAAIAMAASVAAFAAPQEKAKDAKKAKVTDVWTCPIEKKASPKDGESEVVGKYRVHFCCAGCKPAFDKMTAKDKDAKVAAAVKMDAQNAKKDKGAKKKS